MYTCQRLNEMRLTHMNLLIELIVWIVMCSNGVLSMLWIMWTQACNINLTWHNKFNTYQQQSETFTPHWTNRIGGFAKVKTVIEAAGLNKRKYPAWVAQGRGVDVPKWWWWWLVQVNQYRLGVAKEPVNHWQIKWPIDFHEGKFLLSVYQSRRRR